MVGDRRRRQMVYGGRGQMVGVYWDLSEGGAGGMDGWGGDY